jgi:frequently rearranged in advanced T-cell lymphomas 2
VDLHENKLGSLKTMPSKQTNEVLAVDQLVHEIRENLRLKARPAHVSNRATRPSPYQIPSRSWSEPNPSTASGSCGTNPSTTDVVKLKKTSKKNDENAIDDPYELLQQLIKNNSLVKEAVRRLQHGFSPKQRYFYESDEETASPLVVMCQLES